MATVTGPNGRGAREIDLSIIHSRHGELDQAVHHGIAAFGYERKTEALLLSRAEDLYQLLDERHPGEHLADEFRQRCFDERVALQSEAHPDS